jgi:hypothetical protein
MNSIDTFQKEFAFSIIAYTFVLDSFGLFYGDFCMDLYSVDSNEARRHRFNFYVLLNASLLEFLSQH